MNHALEAGAQLRHAANIIELSVINWSESTILVCVLIVLEVLVAVVQSI